jgi:hypothetical protein
VVVFLKSTYYKQYFNTLKYFQKKCTYSFKITWEKKKRTIHKLDWPWVNILNWWWIYGKLLYQPILILILNFWMKCKWKYSLRHCNIIKSWGWDSNKSRNKKSFLDSNVLGKNTLNLFKPKFANIKLKLFWHQHQDDYRVKDMF